MVAPLHRLAALALVATVAAPASAQWTTDSLSEARVDPASTSVAGRSLFAGGAGFAGVSDRVDVYDHATESWLAPASLSAPRQFLAAATAGGKAFFAGGDDGANGFSDVVDVYDSAADRWSVEHLSVPRTIVEGVALGDKVYFAGGLESLPPTFSDVVDVYDTATDSWSVLHLSAPRAFIGATAVGDKLLFAGGTNFAQAYGVVDVYDSSTETWLPPAALSVPRGLWGSETTVGDLAFFAGGTVGPNTASDVIDIYDAALDAWSTAQLSSPRSELRAVTLGQRALFAGGTDFAQSFATVDIYDAGTGLWSTASLSEPRYAHRATVAGGRAMFAGGLGDMGPSATVDVYEPLGSNYCTANTNSTGAPAVITSGGSVSLAQDDLALSAAPVPNEPFVFFCGPNQAQLPFGDGYRCIAGPVVRIIPPASASGNVAERVVDLAAIGVTSPGALSFQCWYRDPAAGGAGFNTSDAVEIVFVP